MVFFADGIGTLKLECPQAHPVGRILRESAHQSVQYDPGASVGERRFWPAEGEQAQFITRCRFCDKQVGEATATLQNKFTELLDDTVETYATTTLPYLQAPANAANAHNVHTNPLFRMHTEER
jgi:hypothetical protein